MGYNVTTHYRCVHCGLLTDAAGNRLTLAQAAALPGGWHDAELTDGACCRSRSEQAVDELAGEFWARVEQRVDCAG